MASILSGTQCVKIALDTVRNRWHFINDDLILQEEVLFSRFELPIQSIQWYSVSHDLTIMVCVCVYGHLAYFSLDNTAVWFVLYDRITFISKAWISGRYLKWGY